MFRSIIDAGTGWAIALGVIAAVNSVIAFFYYCASIRAMWFDEPADGRPHADRRPASRSIGAIALTGAVVVVVGVYPQLFARVGERAF